MACDFHYCSANPIIRNIKNSTYNGFEDNFHHYQPCWIHQQLSQPPKCSSVVVYTPGKYLQPLVHCIRGSGILVYYLFVYYLFVLLLCDHLFNFTNQVLYIYEYYSKVTLPFSTIQRRVGKNSLKIAAVKVLQKYSTGVS